MDSFEQADNKEVLEKMERERLDKSILYKSVFETESGKKVLEELRDVYYYNCRYNPEYSAIECVKWGLIREGQAMVINYINEILNYKGVDNG